MLNKNVVTFVGCKSNYSDSKIVIFGAPFDGTTSFRAGTRFGCSAIRNESYGLETYSPYQDKDLLEINVFDSGDIELPFGNTEKVLALIEERTTTILSDNKIPVMLGGEHLITYGSVRAVSHKYDDLHILHFDAHADLRDTFFGERLSHATVIRRCYDIVGDNKIYQFGIRSGDREEFIFAKEHTFMHKFDLDGLQQAVEKLKGKPIYLTLDLDVLDPSLLSGTGTSEAGGVSFKELLDGLISLTGLNIVACDINELSPHYDNSGVSTAVACKLLREILLIIAK